MSTDTVPPGSNTETAAAADLAYADAKAKADRYYTDALALSLLAAMRPRTSP